MRSPLHRLVSLLLGRTPLGLLPVRVRRGFAAGARWTLYPWTSYWRGTHEPAMQATLAALGGGRIEGWACWDLGAHFGLYSVGLARKAGPTGEVAAFEPNPRSHARLDRHVRLNRLDWVKTYCAAVSDRSGTAELFTDGDLGSTTTHLPYTGEVRTESSAAIAVRTVRLDDLVRTGELRPPNFVKIDVEGHGHQALAGMRETLAAARPILVIGFHSPEERDGCLAILRPLGYRWHEVGAAKSATEPAVGGDYVFEPPA